MKLTNKQALILFQIAQESLKISDYSEFFTMDNSDREVFVNNIINQQGNDLINLE